MHEDNLKVEDCFNNIKILQFFLDEIDLLSQNDDLPIFLLKSLQVASEIILNASKFINQEVVHEYIYVTKRAKNSLQSNNLSECIKYLKKLRDLCIELEFQYKTNCVVENDDNCGDIKLLNERFSEDSECLLTLNDIKLEALEEVKNKLKSGHYSMEEPDCFCGSNEFLVIALKDRFGLPVTSALCKKCGLLMTRPRMAPESYKEFYALEYRRLYSGAEQASDVFFEKQYKHGKYII